MMGDLAAQDAYLPDVGEPLIPSGPQFSSGNKWVNAIAENLPSHVMGGLAEMVKLPGALMKPNPYPEGSEEWHWYNDQRSKAETAWAPGMALNTMGTGVVVPVKPGGVVVGSGPTKSLFDYSRLSEVPNVPQVDLPRNIPPRGVPERTRDITSDKAVRERVLDVIAEGQKLGGANWYNAEPLREAFVRELGSKGDAAFRKYMDMVAATSPRSDVGSNVRNASYYYGRLMRGEDMPAVGDKNPQPYGHMAQRLHQMNAERVAGAGWDPLNNPKPASFVENLVGNQAPVTVDTHAFRLPAILAEDPRFLETAFQVNKDAPKQNIQAMVASGELPMGEVANRAAYWQAQPKANEYAAMENYYKSLGRELGLTPAQTQASAWVGGGKITGLASDESKPFLRFFEDRVNKTAAATEQTPKQVLKKFIRGELPLLSVGGVAMGSVLGDDPR